MSVSLFYLHSPTEAHVRPVLTQHQLCWPASSQCPWKVGQRIVVIVVWTHNREIWGAYLLCAICYLYHCLYVEVTTQTQPQLALSPDICAPLISPSPWLTVISHYSSLLFSINPPPDSNICNLPCHLSLPPIRHSPFSNSFPSPLSTLMVSLVKKLHCFSEVHFVKGINKKS